MSWHLLFVFSIICTNALKFTKRKASLNQLDSVRMPTFNISYLLSTLLTWTSKVVAVLNTNPNSSVNPHHQLQDWKMWNWEDVSLSMAVLAALASEAKALHPAGLHASLWEFGHRVMKCPVTPSWGPAWAPPLLPMTHSQSDMRDCPANSGVVVKRNYCFRCGHWNARAQYKLILAQHAGQPPVFQHIIRLDTNCKKKLQIM